MNNNLNIKKFTVILFLSFIFVVPTINILTEDKKVSETENKILTTFPELSFDSILSKRFMSSFDKYTSDQFPMRETFIQSKNIFSYAVGQREFRNIYLADDRLVEKFEFNEDILSQNLMNIGDISTFMKNKHDINSTVAIIPTSVEFYKDKLPSYALNDSQSDALMFSSELLKNYDIDRFYTPYKVLNNHKDDYIYFNTDHHWTQLGAYISYLDMFGYDIKYSSLFDNYNEVSDSFFGTYNTKVLLPSIKPDSIYSYSNFNDNNIVVDFENEYDTLYDDTKLDTKNQYQYFLHGDPAFAVIDGNKNTASELIIFKDSYAHCFIPFLTNEYSKIHVVDPRYYDIDLDTYLRENPNIDSALFFNNINQLNTEITYKNKV